MNALLGIAAGFPASGPTLAILENVVVKDKPWLYALVLIALVFWLRSLRSVPVMLVPFAALWHRPSPVAFSRWPVGLICSGLALLIVALARPQKIEDKREVNSSGYDIVLCVDLSGSMLAMDYERDGKRINRVQAIKPVVQAFIKNRLHDRIGIVVFSGHAYTLSPLTFDHDFLGRQMERVNVGLIEDGTAIGDGIGVALTRLEQSRLETGGKREGAFIVLLTDGTNTRGALTPQQAGALAKSRGIPVYTIGAGRDGIVPFPVTDPRTNRTVLAPRMSDIDEPTLRDLAAQTGGEFFRAFDTGTVESAFESIDRTRKIDFQAKSYFLTTELFIWPAAGGMALLLMAALLVRRPGGRPSSPGHNKSPATASGGTPRAA